MIWIVGVGGRSCQASICPTPPRTSARRCPQRWPGSSRRVRENNDVVAIMSAGVIEGSAASDKSELRVRGRAVYGRRGKSVLRIFTHRINGEGDLCTVCAVDGNRIAGLKCAESEENAGPASCRIDMPH